MQFQQNLKQEREELESSREELFPENAKVEINELLFKLMPPKTTIEEMECLAVAIHRTIFDAWQQ